MINDILAQIYHSGIVAIIRGIPEEKINETVMSLKAGSIIAIKRL